MEKKYYLILFTQDSWKEFLDNGASIYGTKKNKKGRMDKIGIGEFFICYIAKLSHVAGLLKTTSKAYFDESPIWKDDVYPVRINVKLICQTNQRDGYPISDIRKELSIFKNLKNPNYWGGFFINSLNKIPEEDAKIIIENMNCKFNK